MKEKVKFRISELLIENVNYKVAIRNYSVVGKLTDEIENYFLDKILENEEAIKKFELYLKQTKNEK